MNTSLQAQYQPSRYIYILQHLLTLIILATVFPVLAAKVYTGDPSNYRSQLKKLQPGDHLLLTPGLYRQGLPIHYLNGRKEAPIVIVGSELGMGAVFLARRGHNTISIIDSQHVTLRQMEINGQHLPVDGVKCEGHAKWAHHITLENLFIHRHDHNQQIVGISTKCPAWNWLIRNNVIQGAGTGLYLGNSDGSAPFIAGLIEHNLVTQTLGYNLQIKHQNPRPSLPSMPHDPSITIIRHNVFDKASTVGQTQAPRPNVLVGHWPLSGVGKDDQYLIYGNFFHQNTQASLFQGEGNIALYNNIFINHHGGGIRIQPHNDIPRKVSIFFNTILTSGGGIHLSNKKGFVRFPQWISNNAVFAGKPLTGTAINTDNFIQGFEEAENFLLQPFAPLGQMKLVPQPQKIRQKKIDVSKVRNYLDWGRDFDGQSNDHRYGAYAYNKRLSWAPRLEIKPKPVP